MKLSRKITTAFLATTAIAFGIAAHAESGGDCDMKGGHMPGMGMMGQEGRPMMGDPAARAEARLAHFKAELKLTPQQEPLWNAFAEKAKAEAGQGMKMMRERSPEKMAAPERMNLMVEVMKNRVAALESLSESFKRLYDGLTPEQKAIADKQGMHGRHRAPPAGKPGAGKPQG